MEFGSKMGSLWFSKVYDRNGNMGFDKCLWRKSLWKNVQIAPCDRSGIYELIEIRIIKFGVYLNYLGILQYLWKEKGRKGVNLIKRTGRSPAKQRLLGSAQWLSCAREEVTPKAHYRRAPPSGASGSARSRFHLTRLVGRLGHLCCWRAGPLPAGGVVVRYLAPEGEERQGRHG